MTPEQYQLHLVETLQDLTDHGLALLYGDYMDDFSPGLINGLVSECNRRGLTLNDLEQMLDTST
tara:strand:- start:292 stop:483 length:192 start_codon:yes stop_codon:yes gene_type:complete